MAALADLVTAWRTDADARPYLVPSFGSSRSPLRRAMTDSLATGLSRTEVRSVVEAVLTGAASPRDVVRILDGPPPESGVPFGFRTFVYFMRLEVPMARLGRPIKIGRSEKPEARRRMILTSVPYPVTILATFPEPLLRENYLHAAFASHRMQGEWFRPCVRLRRLIAELEVFASPEARADAASRPFASLAVA